MSGRILEVAPHRRPEPEILGSPLGRAVPGPGAYRYVVEYSPGYGMGWRVVDPAEGFFTRREAKEELGRRKARQAVWIPGAFRIRRYRVAERRRAA